MCPLTPWTLAAKIRGPFMIFGWAKGIVVDSKRGLAGVAGQLLLWGQQAHFLRIAKSALGSFMAASTIPISM